MPRSPRNAHAALGWLAITSVSLALFVGVALGQVKDDVPRDSEQAPAEAVAQQEDPPTPPSIQAPPPEVAGPKIYEPDCDAPDSREEADLCAQRSMAKAAEETLKWVRESVEWAERLYYATIGEIVALVMTIGIATAAVIVAFKANKIARTTAKRELRAYLSAIPAGIDQLIGELDGLGIVAIRNVGHLPAKNVAVHVFMKLSGGRDENFPVPEDNEIVKRAILPDAEMRQGSRDHIPVTELCTSGGYVYVWGVTYYDDGYKCRRTTRFCHRYATSAHNLEVLASLNREALGRVSVPKTRRIIDADKARYHTEGNDAD